MGKQKPYGSKMEKFDVVGRSSRCSQSTDKHLHLWNFSLSAPNFENTLIVAIKQRGTAEVVIGDMIKTIDSIINHSLFSIAE